MPGLPKDGTDSDSASRQNGLGYLGTGTNPPEVLDMYLHVSGEQGGELKKPKLES